MNAKKFKNIDEYIAIFPKEVRDKLSEIRRTIKKAAPLAQEKISYNMPSFNFHGYLVYFAAYKSHIGFYPASKAMIVFKKELTSYKTSKGTIQFPLDKPIPFSLITKIVKYRVKENLEKIKKY